MRSTIWSTHIFRRRRTKRRARWSAEIARVDKLDEPNFAAGYALAAVPARWALERRDWAAAKALTVTPRSFPWAKVPYAEAITHFARAVGAARLKDAATARSALARLEKIKADLAQGPAGPTTGCHKSRYSGWPLSAGSRARRGQTRRPLRNLRAAADLEDARDKHPVTPGSVLPAREQLADLLAELGRAKEALAEYEATLEVTPRRFRSLAGAAAAARTAGDAPKAEKYAGELLQLASHGDGLRPELAARKIADGREVAWPSWPPTIVAQLRAARIVLTITLSGYCASSARISVRACSMRRCRSARTSV
jgi:tetratricopeptide (TPR) repeat protein